MEIIQDISSQYILNIPVVFIVLVIAAGILVFTFGFKSAEQPPFDKLTLEDKKLVAKKRKIKERKSTTNGYVANVDTKNEKDTKKSPVKETSDVKQEKKDKKPDSKQTEKNKKNEINKLKSNTEDIKIKKNVKKVSGKPLDFDEGDWETVPTKLDKKKKGDQSPDKKEKKTKRHEKEESEKKGKPPVSEKLQEVAKNERIEESEETVIELPKIDIRNTINEQVVVLTDEKSEKEKKKKEKNSNKAKSEKLLEQEKEVTILVDLPKSSPVEKTVSSDSLENKSESKETAAVFDELGDVWTEAKVAKKTSKKKARRDN